MRAIFPGSFDPITLGHIDFMWRAAAMVDELIIAVAQNESKQALFSFQQRFAFVEASLPTQNCRAVSFDGLLVDFMRSEGLHLVMRGVRNEQDCAYEMQFYHANHLLDAGIEMLFMPASHNFRYISSTFVRELIKNKGPVEKFVPTAVISALSA